MSENVMRLRDARISAGLTQNEVSERLGVSQGVISSWETEGFLPRTRQLPLLASVLGCSINDLFAPCGAAREEDA